MKTRIAPTPSGFLHVGNAVSFLITYCLAKSENGKLLLRIDDLDRERYRKEYLEDIFYALDWLGIQYDEGPSSVADFDKYWSQHQRLSLYDDVLNLPWNRNGFMLVIVPARTWWLQVLILCMMENAGI